MRSCLEENIDLPSVFPKLLGISFFTLLLVASYQFGVNGLIFPALDLPTSKLDEDFGFSFFELLKNDENIMM